MLETRQGVDHLRTLELRAVEGGHLVEGEKALVRLPASAIAELIDVHTLLKKKRVVKGDSGSGARRHEWRDGVDIL